MKTAKKPSSILPLCTILLRLLIFSTRFTRQLSELWSKLEGSNNDTKFFTSSQSTTQPQPDTPYPTTPTSNHPAIPQAKVRHRQRRKIRKGNSRTYHSFATQEQEALHGMCSEFIIELLVEYKFFLFPKITLLCDYKGRVFALLNMEGTLKISRLGS